MKTDPHAASPSIEAIFDRTVCGVDASEAGTEAPHYAARITAPDGSGKPLDHEKLGSIENLEFDERKPADYLVGASNDADLLVLGSRGLHSFAALGSVSERVAHKASCPVLVVR